MSSSHATLFHATLFALCLALFVALAWVVWRRRRVALAPGELLGTHLALGLLGSAAALALFVDVATGVLHPGAMARVDAHVHDALYRAGSPASVACFRAVTWLGAPQVLVPVAAVISAALARHRRWALCIVWSCAIAGQIALDLELKHLFHRARPVVRYIDVTGWSFPSGHSMGSVVFYGLGAFLLAQRFRRPAQRTALVAGAVAMVLLIGASRLFLGVHWFFDVVGGFCAGVVWLAAWITVLEVLRRRAGMTRAPVTSPRCSASGPG